MAEKDPYQVLGVSPTATDEEIKKAYRALARKYHPDKYQDSDLKDLADEKMKEVNLAYDQIRDMRSGKNTGGYRTGNSGQGSWNQQYSTNSSSPLYAEVRRFINAGNIAAAEERLTGVHEGDRSAEWHFLTGCVLLRKGRYVDAQEALNRACAMDPHNAEYRNVRDQLAYRANGYGGSYRTTRSSDGCDCCMNLVCADMCCECMGGDLIRCC